MRKLAAFGCLWAVAAKVPLRPPAHGQRRQSPHSVHQSRRRGPAARVGNAENHGTAKPLRPPVSLADDTVCAAIPCTRAHWGPLLRRSLDSVAKQTRRVDRVVVVLSLVGLKPDEFKKMCAARQTELSTWHANATLVCATAKRGDRTHAANRNAAGRSCNTTWIAFVDADDEMQPERVERMLGHVLRHRADIGLHSFEFRRPQAIGLNSTTLSFGLNSTTSRGRHLPPDSLQPKITTPFMLWASANRTAEPIKGLGPVGELVTGSRVHLGHSFVRTAALREIPQPEGREYYRREDLTWFRRAVWAGLRAVLTNEQLSVYYGGTAVSRHSSFQSDHVF